MDFQPDKPTSNLMLTMQLLYEEDIKIPSLKVTIASRIINMTVDLLEILGFTVSYEVKQDDRMIHKHEACPKCKTPKSVM